MIKVMIPKTTEFLSPEDSFEWFDLTSREIAIIEKNGNINLELVNDGQDNTILHRIASVDIDGDVLEKYAEDEHLKPTITQFTGETISKQTLLVDRMLKSALSNAGMTDFTNVATMEIKVFLRNNIVVAAISPDGSEFAYSMADNGVFDKLS